MVSLQQMVLIKYITCESRKLKPYLTSHTQIKTKTSELTDLNARTGFYKLLEEKKNTWKRHDFNLLPVMATVVQTKAKITEVCPKQKLKTSKCMKMINQVKKATCCEENIYENI